MFFSITGLLCITYVQSANILGVFFFPSISHQIIHLTISQELSLRGHQVTIVTPNPLNNSSLTNLTEISVSFIYKYFSKVEIGNLLAKDQTTFQNTVKAFETMRFVADAELGSTQYKKLIGDQNKHFDLVLVECFEPALYAFARRFNAPVIGVSSTGALTAELDAVGNPIFPIINPDIFLSFDKKLSMWEKIYSVGYSLWARYYHRSFVQPRAHEMAQKHFGDDIEFVGDVEKRQDLFFLNTNPAIYQPAPNIPTVVELGFIHIKPSRPLPPDLQEFLDEAIEGVVYFSLGSNVKSIQMPQPLRKTITQALSELPYKVLWKWESDHLPGKPENVVIRKWLPQQDVLAHPNVKVFVTQGGFQSIEEAIARRIPMVGMPFMCDQPRNVRRLVDLGIGLRVDPTTLTKDELKKNIIEVVESSRYKDRIRQVHDLVYDRPMSGIEKAVWWSEYVIRHRGAKHLRSARSEMSWFHYLLLDVVLAVVATIVLICVCLKLSKMVKK